MKTRTLIMLFAAVVSINSLSSFAQEGVMANDENMKQMEEITPEQKMMMENFQAYATPNENHALLAQMEGTWNAKITHWMMPNTEGETMLGVGKSKMTMGGRFLEQDFTGEYQGQPFIGRGVYGYDNIKKEFTGIWYDNMGTGIMTSQGSYDDTSKSLSEEGTMSCPITNSERWHRSKTTFVDAEHYTYETFMKDEAGKEYKAMLIEYTKS